MILRLSAALVISCVSLFASPIGIQGLTCISSDPGQIVGGFTVTDFSGLAMPYRCDNAFGIVSCGARQPQNRQWRVDYSDNTVGLVSAALPADA